MLAARYGLEQRLAELSREVRGYPTPIARCDQHLSALLEARARVLADLERLYEACAGGCPPESAWRDDGGRGD
jgi:hypothetical protein